MTAAGARCACGTRLAIPVSVREHRDPKATMVMRSTVSERWFFYQDAAGLWKWARLDVLGNILAHSGASFDSRDACVDHARLSGYALDCGAAAGVALPQDASLPASLLAASRI